MGLVKTRRLMAMQQQQRAKAGMKPPMKKGGALPPHLHKFGGKPAVDLPRRTVSNVLDDALRTSAISELPASLRLNYDEIMWYNFQRDEWRHFLRENKVFGNIMENRYGCR